jgi:hypothetical protein
MILPAVFIGGVILIPVGMYLRLLRERRGAPPEAEVWPSIDLNKRGHRRAAIVFLVGLMGFLVVSAVGTYHAYHYTESVEFCGETCHVLMQPEFTAYQHSPHARVKCVECHIGSGAGWYAKSKISGAYQVYATVANKYPKPIPTPIENLRPAQETCEQCHWPQAFFGAQQRQFNHYMYNDSNTHWPINMLIKTGGGDPKTGQTSGIHWHMNIGVEVDYIARDERRQDIPWVRVTDKQTGRVTVYQNEASPLSEDEVKAATPRRMDCMDCHNRPSHKYNSPDHEVDLAILTSRIDRTLPGVKSAAVKAMAGEYETSEDALKGIANSMTEYYREQHPDVYAQRRGTVDEAIVETQAAFSRSIFPEMKVKWSEYPDNIGHFNFPGCMRCHQGSHKSPEGLVLTHDCNACHSILSQGTGERAQVSASHEGLEFLHPEDIGDAWREALCSDCHTGVQP